MAKSIRGGVVLAAVLAVASGCATTGGALRSGQRAERAQDYDLAVAEYTKALREKPQDVGIRAALENARLRAAEAHFTRGRRLVSQARYEEALIELQVAGELNPGAADIDDELRRARAALRAKLALESPSQTQLQSVVERSRTQPPPGLDLPEVKMPSTIVTGPRTSSRELFQMLARFADINIIFDPTFESVPAQVDFRGQSLRDALDAVATSTRTFWRVTAPRTITIIPDTPAKRSEYQEEVVRTFYLSNADLKETADLLRVVIDARQVYATTATNSITLRDTPERIEAAGRLLNAIDKARPEVVVHFELMEVDRERFKEYGLQIASGASAGIDGGAAVNEEGLTLRSLRSLSQSDVVVFGIPALYYRLLKTDTNTRTLARVPLRVSDGLAAQARFGERVPVPVTTFAPIATGGINQQPITSFVYENIGVNIDVVPRLHHDDEVTLALKIEVSNISGASLQGLPVFGSRAVSTTIRLRDGERNILAGLIRDDERRVLDGVPGLSDLPIVGRLFARNERQTKQTDVVITMTPHIVRVLDLTDEDLRAFKMVNDSGLAPAPAVQGVGVPQMPPRDPRMPAESELTSPQPGFPIGSLPPVQPIRPPAPPPKKPGGGGN